MSYIYGAPILDVSRSHTTTQQSRWDSSGRVISSSQRPLPDNTQHSQQTNIHDLGGIQTHDLSRRAAADLRLRPRGHWDRHVEGLCMRNWYFFLTGQPKTEKLMKIQRRYKNKIIPLSEWRLWGCLLDRTTLRQLQENSRDPRTPHLVWTVALSLQTSLLLILSSYPLHRNVEWHSLATCIWI